MTFAWDDALGHCDGLDWGGHTDWRLPDIYELKSVMDFESPSGAMIDGSAFPDTPLSSPFWSSTTYTGFDHQAMYLDHQHETVVLREGDKTEPYQVRCVRQEPAPGPTRRGTG